MVTLLSKNQRTPGLQLFLSPPKHLITAKMTILQILKVICRPEGNPVHKNKMYWRHREEPSLRTHLPSLNLSLCATTHDENSMPVYNWFFDFYSSVGPQYWWSRARKFPKGRRAKAPPITLRSAMQCSKFRPYIKRRISPNIPFINEHSEKIFSAQTVESSQPKQSNSETDLSPFFFYPRFLPFASSETLILALHIPLVLWLAGLWLGCLTPWFQPGFCFTAFLTRKNCQQCFCLASKRTWSLVDLVLFWL